MRLPDTDRSVAVLIGTSHYRHMNAIPAVEGNLRTLSWLLTASGLSSIAAERCAVLANPGDPLFVAQQLAQLAEQATDTFVVYYTGHGLVGPRGGLYLALPGTDPAWPASSAISYEDVVAEVFRHGTSARHRILILDCCFSGRAADEFGSPADAWMGYEQVLPPQLEIGGTYILAASPGNMLAHFSVGAGYTTFTGALLHVLTVGIDGAGQYLDLPTVYPQLREAIRAAGAPPPRQHLTDNTGAVALVRNAAFQVEIRVGDFISISADGSYTVEPRDFHGLMGRREFDKALELLKIHEEQARMERAESLEKSGQLTEAENAYREAIAAGFEQAQAGLALLLYGQGRLSEAEPLCWKAIDDGLVRMVRTLTKILLQRGRPDDAVFAYQRILSKRETLEDGRRVLAYTDLRPNYVELLIRLGRHAEVEVVCREAMADRYMDYYWAYPIRMAGFAYTQQRDRTRAVRALRPAAEAGDETAAEMLAQLIGPGCPDRAHCPGDGWTCPWCDASWRAAQRPAESQTDSGNFP